MLIDQAQGLFGTVSVIDQQGGRFLMIDQQMQGGVALDGDGTPGPVAAAAYQAGWLLPLINPLARRGLMVGLGSGSGVCVILENAPAFELTVVDIDPTVIRLARAHFPLLDRYEDEQRLHIRSGEVADLLIDQDADFDVGFLDAYEGRDQLVAPAELVGMLCSCCRNLYVNLIDRPDGPSVTALYETLRANGLPPRWQFRAGAQRSDGVSNLVVTTEDLSVDQLGQSLPVAYPHDRSPAADRLRRYFTDLVVHAEPINDT